jgi:hypothetical protein
MPQSQHQKHPPPSLSILNVFRSCTPSSWSFLNLPATAAALALWVLLLTRSATEYRQSAAFAHTLAAFQVIALQDIDMATECERSLNRIVEVISMAAVCFSFEF